MGAGSRILSHPLRSEKAGLAVWAGGDAPKGEVSPARPGVGAAGAPASRPGEHPRGRRARAAASPTVAGRRRPDAGGGRAGGGEGPLPSSVPGLCGDMVRVAAAVAGCSARVHLRPALPPSCSPATTPRSPRPAPSGRSGAPRPRGADRAGAPRGIPPPGSRVLSAGCAAPAPAPGGNAGKAVLKSRSCRLHGVPTCRNFY